MEAHGTNGAGGARARACLDRLIPEAIERAAADYRGLAREGGPALDDAAGWTRRLGALKAGVAHLEALCRLAAAARRLNAEGAGAGGAAGDGGTGGPVPDLAGLIAGARADLARADDDAAGETDR